MVQQVGGEKFGGRRAARAGLCTAAVCMVLAAAPNVACAQAEIGYDTPLTLAPGQPAIISSDIDPNTNYYSIINTLTGADRFYNAGYLGANAVIANVEAGYVWNGHETLGNVTSFVSNSPVNATAPQYDYHATAVGFILVGQGSYPYYYYQLGMAPEAALSSVSIASSWVGTTGEFSITSSTYVYGYNTVMSAPVTVTHEYLGGLSVTGAAHVDVVNSSWGFTDPAANSQETLIMDALTSTYHQTVCIAAGNHEGASAQVSGPASAFNVIAVGALTGDLTDPKYSTIADFSNTGPNDFYNPATGQTIPGVRAAVSLCAPGAQLIVPAYTGATGTNSSGTLFDTSGFTPDQLNKLYFLGVAGTSFASPIVAGGAGLLVDAGYANFGGGASVDGRVVKAVLLNSARKTPGWSNNTENVNGVLVTTQGLDWSAGAGMLDLNAAYDQYLSGTTNNVPITGGTVLPLGWAMGHVKGGVGGAPNDYLINVPLHQGDTFTATLDWFIPVYFNANATPDDFDNFASTDLHNLYFDQLDLQVWQVVDGTPTTLIADSTSPYNNVDHLYFSIPQDGMYAVRVSFVGTTYDVFSTSPLADDYGLAWSDVPAPEPGTLGLLGLGLLAVRRRTRSRKI